MLVQMRKQIGGFRNLEPWPAPGGVIDVPDGEARDLIAHGYAVAVTADVDATEEADSDDQADEDNAPAVDGDEATAGEWFDEAAADDVDEPAPKPARSKKS